ncbi:gas vesicle protein [Nocardioides sp. DS6]|uniref:Gas vesicle protein n=1 Tax=Nocardioides eburneus TaxID=3231482 RepID=A0ABV3T557_9ACTN
MTESAAGAPAPRSYVTPQGTSRAPNPASLADILERVLDKGIIIAGDIRVNLLDIELLTIKIRLLVASVDKAQEMGIDWWRNDPLLTSSEQGMADENRRLRERVEALEAAHAHAVEEREEAPEEIGAVRSDEREEERHG